MTFTGKRNLLFDEIHFPRDMPPPETMQWRWGWSMRFCPHVVEDGDEAGLGALSEEAGEAPAKYLRHGRPRCASRRVFIGMKASRQGFTGSSAICNVVRRALDRAGLSLKHKGSHLFRHGLATRMLRGGASLAEIGEILRHQRPSRTEIYAKVDVAALRALALPWKGGAR